MNNEVKEILSFEEDADYKRLSIEDILLLKEYIERLNNIIYTTLEYVDREEINSTGKPYIYTERGKHIKELLEGERTFNSLWQENNRLNNIINELVKFMDEDYEYYEKYGHAEQGHAMGQIRRIKNKLQELKGVDKK